MPHPDLSDTIKKIQRAALSARFNSSNLSQLIAEACRFLDTKFPSPNNSIATCINNFRSNISHPNPQNVNALLQTQDFKNLLKRKVEAIYHTSNKVQEIFSPELTDFMDCVRLEDRLIIENPHIALSNNTQEFSIQSWARPKSKSSEYNRHLQNSRNRDKSKFSLALNIVEQIELAVFNKGYGRMEQSDRMFFYGKISRNIGQLANRRPVPYVRLQCDRVHRPTGTGTRVEIHGYPISPQEIISDFSNYRMGIDMIELIDDRPFNF